MDFSPYVRATWQNVTQSSFSENQSSAANIEVYGYNGTGVRTMVGLSGGSVATDPLTARVTYKFNVGVGEDAGNLTNPSLRASLDGVYMPIEAPHVSSTFGQASVGGTVRLKQGAYAYGDLFGEVHSNEDIAGISAGLRLKF